MRGPNIFTIPAGAPFLDSLAAALIDGALVEGFDARGPFALADVTLYLPTRRAARAVRESLLKALGRPVLLPRIRALGDMDEDDPNWPEPGSDAPAAIERTERQLALTRLVLAWSGALVRAAAELPEEDMVVPASPADAARLAHGLGGLLDQVGPDTAAWEALASAVPADMARYWEITLDFLKIVTQAWPKHLAEGGLVDPGTRRDMLIRAEAARLAAHGSAGPVVAAGSTGSAPATAELLGAIARLPNGAVVLPGLDQHLDAESWAEIGPSEREPAGAGHPQYGLKLLLASLGARREDVQPIGVVAAERAGRARLVSEALRPAGTTERWTTHPALGRGEIDAALGDLRLVEAANEREEALAIAIILRETAETPDKTAALVTPDRGLARRVAVELRRWGIEVDDSAGRPLGLTPPGVLARLTAEAALRGAAAETILALAKHPLAAFGLRPAEARRAARSLERAVLRGPQLNPGLGTLRHALRAAEARRWSPVDETARPAQAAAGLSRRDWEEAAELAKRVEAALLPLESFAHRAGATALALLVDAHRQALAAVLQASEPSRADEADDALAAFFESLCAGAHAGPQIAAADYPALFSALMEVSSVRRRGGVDPRIHIWGTLEARLQSVDVAILGGLNEGGWPAQTRLDPLLSRPLRAALALDPPERRIGLAAHDFAQALGQPVVWLTRANRENNEPRVASRWLQRINAYAGEAAAKAMTARGARMLALARRLDRAEALAAAPRPCPSPPPALRPRSLSATQIETLIRDPYAIYARQVLRLRPFEGLAELPGAGDRGNVIHAALEQFVAERPAGPFDAAAEKRLLEIGRERFAAYADFPEIGILWWPRFERVARWFVQTEQGRADVAERLVEQTGRWPVSDTFTLTGRADRLDRLTDGRWAVVDYKTGRVPSNDEVLSLAPQLPLEALMLRHGAFEKAGRGEAARLEYLHVTGRGEGGAVCERGFRDKARNGKPAVTLDEALTLTERRLSELIAAFEAPEAQYLSRKIPRKGGDYAGDYDHLARVAEWSVAADAEADA